MYSQIVEHLRNSFASGKTREIPWRKRQLKAFLSLLQENRDELCNAVQEDLHKHPAETMLMELAGVENEINRMLRCLDEKAKPEKISGSLLAVMNSIYVRKEPYGVCLIIGAWNYPILLSLQPVVGAIAAGNCVLLKPSEVSPNTARVLQNLIPKYLDTDCYSIVVTGPQGSSDLINNNRFDLIFYTGGSVVGKLVMQAACKHLTPVILELGGKNPCYVDKGCDLDSAARCITWGKWTNCGQICVAPDYVLCEASVRAKLIEKLKTCIEEFYGADPKQSPSYGRIVNERSLRRLESLLKGVDVVHGGVIDEGERYMSPTIVTNIKKDAPIRDEEVFGPILPIYEVEGVDDAIDMMNTGEKSLQLSVFAKDRSIVDRVVAKTSSGGVTVNELLMQHNELDLPFGGVGGSGMGYYHGKYSFDSFCHQRAYYESKTPDIINNIKYPPYSDKQLALLKPIVFQRKPLSGALKFVLKLTMLAALGALISYVYHVVFRE